MTGWTVNIVAGGLVALGTLGAPNVASAQRYAYDDRPSVVVQCGPGQRAVMEQTRFNGRTHVVARCSGWHARRGVYDDYGRAIDARRVAERRAPRRSATKSALMIAGSTAAGAGVGGALKGTKGALIGAAIGGGSASIYEAAKRR